MGKKKEAGLIVINVNGVIVIGTRTDNTIVGVMLQGAKQVNQDDFAMYLKAKNMEELITMEVGANSDVVVRELTRREALDYNMVQAEWDEAADMAENQLVNDVFDQFRGKQ